MSLLKTIDLFRRFSIFFFLKNSSQTIFKTRRPRSDFILFTFTSEGDNSTKVLSIEEKSPLRLSRGRIKLTFIHRREIPGYHNRARSEGPARGTV